MARVLLALALSLVVLAIAAAAWIGGRLADVPALDIHALPFPVEVVATDDAAARAESGSGFEVTFLGVSTLLFDDGETAFLTDGFFSRPSFREVLLTSLEPDRAAIQRVLTRTGIERLEAVIPLHAHFDHAMDAPTVAALTGARVIGSESVANIALGLPLPAERIQRIEHGEQVQLGRFRLSFIESVHAPGDRAPGVIDEPLRTPAHATRYRTGSVYSLRVEHEGRAVLVHSSAGFIPGALDGHAADVVYLGIGDLGAQDEAYREAYWDEVVGAVGARRVVLTHWDNLFEPLTRPLEPAPRLYQDHRPAMQTLYRLKQRDGMDLRLPRAFRAADPFSGLPEPVDETPPLRLRRLPELTPRPPAGDAEDQAGAGAHQSVGR